MQKPIKVWIPPDLMHTIKRGLACYERDVYSRKGERASVNAMELSDILQARRVLAGLGRFDNSKDEEIK